MKVSIIVPTNKGDLWTTYCLRKLCYSIEKFREWKELILVLDAPYSEFDTLINQLSTYKFVRPIILKSHKGVAYARSQGIKEVRGDILLFTDADCVVGNDWVSLLSDLTSKYDICTGRVEKVFSSKKPTQKEKMIAKLEEYTDRTRNVSKDKKGEFRYLTFQNFGIRKNKMLSFSLSANNTTEDIFLAAMLRLNNEKIHYIDSVEVKTGYPPTIYSEVQRKIKHGRGVAWLRYNLGANKWEKLGFESFTQLFVKWTKISFQLPFSFKYKFMYTIFNWSYIFSLYWYFLKFSLFFDK
jgi:glycosyltransferase involved in cell wall biosynthesis